MNIAIDGPAGSGKSTVAKRLAKGLSFIYVDTGALYRAMALYCLENDIDTKDKAKVSEAVNDMDIALKYERGTQIVLLNGRDVSGLIRTEEVSKNTSVISAYPKVREKLLGIQQDIAKKNDVIMDGRDIGTNVLPGAELKIFLTASVKVRAKRRYDELKERGEDADLYDIEKDIKERDERDTNRDIAPLRKAGDAIEIDTSSMTIDEVTKKIREMV